MFLHFKILKTSKAFHISVTDITKVNIIMWTTDAFKKRTYHTRNVTDYVNSNPGYKIKHHTLRLNAAVIDLRSMLLTVSSICIYTWTKASVCVSSPSPCSHLPSSVVLAFRSMVRLMVRVHFSVPVALPTRYFHVCHIPLSVSSYSVGFYSACLTTSALYLPRPALSPRRISHSSSNSKGNWKHDQI